MFHRSKAELVVATWNKQLQNPEKDQRVPLLYLANDILQKDKRKGNEFVTEFWKVLPTALKDVLEKGDDEEKHEAIRLVYIWEKRRVFESHTMNLINVLLGEKAQAPPQLEFNKKRSRSVRIVKKDSRSIKTKLSIGGTAEKIVSAFHTVLNKHSDGDAEMSKCKSSIHHVRKMEKIVDIACAIVKDPKRKTLSKELMEEENILKECIKNLKLFEASRSALVTQLKEALREQASIYESELENVRTQIQVAQAQVEEASYMRKRLDDEDSSSKASIATPLVTDVNTKSEAASKKSAAAIAAEVADKLAASSSSQFIMTSVLSSFAAEEAKNACLTSESVSKPEKSIPVSDPNVMSSQQLIATPNHSYPSVLVPQPTLQNPTATSQSQYQLLCNPTSHHYLQSTGGVISPYGYGSVPPLPPGPPPPHMVGPMVPLTHQTMQIAQLQPAPIAPHQPIKLTQQAPAPPSFRPLQPPGMVYYGNHQHSI
ncbi:unnamed protein product [Sphenostylis stenocarpa]|uniref:CID domain-containing protein n=1 Tax=Sphenostylis stenocarpa TaxID=92480 RepID=A0AA86S1B2_9FABA|nr:unnamed protein product [Sphenostylis stenocarpa]